MWMLLHGFMGSPRSWERAVSTAELSHDPMAPFLMGHGTDWKTTRVASFEEEVARLLEMASTMERPRHLCGYSMGARVALGMLVAGSDLFEGAVLIGVHPGLEDVEARRGRRTRDAALADELRTGGLPTFVDAWERQPLFASQRGMPPETLDIQRGIRLSHDAEGLASSLDVLGLGEMPAYGAALGLPSIPVKFMVGELDAKFGAIMRDLSSDIHEGHVVNGVGHNVLLEAPQAVAVVLKTMEQLAYE